MTDSLSAHLVRLLRIHHEATLRLIDAVRSVAEAETSDNLHRREQVMRATRLLAHVTAANVLWLGRLDGSGRVPPELFPQGDWATLRQNENAVAEGFLAWVESAALAQPEGATTGSDGSPQGGWDQWVEYVSTEGLAYRSRRCDVLLHVFHHGGHHRGQVCLLLRALGVEPPVVDVIAWVREPHHHSGSQPENFKTSELDEPLPSGRGLHND